MGYLEIKDETERREETGVIDWLHRMSKQEVLWEVNRREGKGDLMVESSLGIVEYMVNDFSKDDRGRWVLRLRMSRVITFQIQKILS